jgi:hypothetical protein
VSGVGAEGGGGEGEGEGEGSAVSAGGIAWCEGETGCASRAGLGGGAVCATALCVEAVGIGALLIGTLSLSIGGALGAGTLRSLSANGALVGAGSIGAALTVCTGSLSAFCVRSNRRSVDALALPFTGTGTFTCTGGDADEDVYTTAAVVVLATTAAATRIFAVSDIDAAAAVFAVVVAAAPALAATARRAASFARTRAASVADGSSSLEAVSRRDLASGPKLT